MGLSLYYRNKEVADSLGAGQLFLCFVCPILLKSVFSEGHFGISEGGIEKTEGGTEISEGVIAFAAPLIVVTVCFFLIFGLQVLCFRLVYLQSAAVLIKVILTKELNKYN